MFTATSVLNLAPLQSKLSATTGPPIFNEEGDVQKYCPHAAKWIKTIQPAGEYATDQFYKTLHVTLARQFYDFYLPTE